MRFSSTVGAIALVFGANAVALAQANPPVEKVADTAAVADAKAAADRCAKGPVGTSISRDVLRALDGHIDDALRLIETQVGRKFSDHEVLCITQSPAFVRTFQQLRRDFCSDPANSKNLACEQAAESGS